MANQEHAKRLKQGIGAWNDWREKAEVWPNLIDADLSGVDLRNAGLSVARLSHAKLSSAYLNSTNLNGAKFHTTRLNSTIFSRVDLCGVEGLNTAIHTGRSIVDVNTVRLPEGETRMHFLRGAGFSDALIEYLPSLLTAAIQYASCFISYAHADEGLTRRLYKDLQDKGVRCWFAPHDLRPGALFHRGIEDAIHFHEKVLLLLSEHAVASNWVAHEVETTLNRQARERRELLFPVRLDEAIMLAKQNWAVRLRESRHIGDFSGWQDEMIYQQRFADLLRHMVATIKTSLSLPKTLCNQAETLAQYLNISRNHLFGMAIEHFIRTYQSQTPRDEMNTPEHDQPDLNEASQTSGQGTRPERHMGEERMGIDQGDIYWVQLEELSGSEPGIRHPYVVIQDTILNYSRIHTVVACALTSNRKRASTPGNVCLEAGEANLPKQSVVEVSKVSIIKKTQLGEYIGSLTEQRTQQILAGMRFQQLSFFTRS